VLACGLLSTPDALGAGGNDIASAPAVAYGQQEFGNTATDNGKEGCRGYESWWSLAVLAGDRVTIDFEGPGAQYDIVWPPGTTDFNVNSTQYFQKAEVSDNGKQEATFTATQTGAMPLDFATDDCDFGSTGKPGPYDFTAYVKHSALLSLSRYSSIRRSGTLTVAVHDPDGGAISDPGLAVTLQGRRGSRWTNLGSGAANQGVATINYAMPQSFRHHKILLRAVASGPNYRSTSTKTQHARVT
jgi:hypothetical protein